MDIRKENQYNQPMGKYKTLSSAAGIGSIITTKWGGFIMPLSIDNWKFIEVVTNKIKEILPQSIDTKKIQEVCGVELIEDPRFVEFLNVKKGFVQLRCFASIPHIQLNSFNQIQRKGNPLYERIKDRFGTELGEDMFYIPAINFPQWFISANSEIRELGEWRKEWQTRRCNDGKMVYFVPPRDPNKKTSRKIKAEIHDDVEYGLLKPVPLILICPNGHISDIPWYKYYCAALKHEKMDDENGFELFGYDCEDCSCGGKHNIKWLNSRNQAESWGTLKCSKCGLSVSLAGIMNIKPYCRGERPWINKDNTYERCQTNFQKTKMQVAMVTSNSIYYASSFSSLFIPKEFIPKKAGQLNDEARTALNKVTDKYNAKVISKPELTKEKFWTKQYGDCDDFIEDAKLDWNLYNLTEFDYEVIKNTFLGLSQEEEDKDPVATYRLTEFEVFVDDKEPNRISDGLEFNEIDIPNSLKPYFKSIKQVNTLSLTTTQLGFGRVNMPTSKLGDNGMIIPPGDEMKPIFDGTPADIYVMPANKTFGEGLFFAFDMDVIEQWTKQFNLEKYYECQLDTNSMGDFLYEEISLYGRAKFYLLHTFSHVLMKELEFSCGYPTASLNERLYYSDKMCGVLIYTADGAEGSMGGLVWQGQPRLISNIIESAMKRAVNCSSDPLCWENEDGLNKASCFGCTMVSETSCEHQNLGLDRRVLVDDDFGFFKKLTDVQ
ncbi:MAG: DUF1998 domain-containing protein [Agathobacter sp.]|nr:DUF1998 domain-containing protein [Agathobacter sp.]